VSVAAAIDREAEYEALLQFLYMAPVGLVQTLPDGEIVLINPLSAQLLMPLSRDGTLSNLFTALKSVAPNLGHLADCFAAQQGSICEDMRISVKAESADDLQPRMLSLSLVKLDPNRLMAVLSDVTLQAKRERELDQYREHLEQLVAARTAALESASLAAAADHRASVERLNAERDARIQSGKLEAMGTLAAGIAHDFNNILASILACAELTDDEVPDDSEAKKNIALIIKSSFRARDLVARMLDFARERPGASVRVNIVPQIREALALLRASLPPAIDLAFECGTRGDISILADPTHIMQIVMNLCINAAHAMNNHGVIGIAVEPAHAVLGASTEQIEGVCITVTDTGSGMTPAVLERIFDPFFTTKAPGEGSGLGLSVVYGIVKNLRGEVTVRSSTVPPDSGTRFQVFLPIDLVA